MLDHRFILRVLFTQEGDLWAAQCIDHDIAAQGKTIGEAKQVFERTIIGQILRDIKDGREPLAAFPPAPKSYREKFDQAEELADKRPIQLPAGVPPAFMVSQITKDMRVW
jgi:hypothetical protein